MRVKIFSNGISSELAVVEGSINEWLQNNEGKIIVRDANVGYAATTGGYRYAIITVWYEDLPSGHPRPSGIKNDKLAGK